MGASTSVSTTEGDFTAAPGIARTTAASWEDGDLDGTTAENAEEIHATPDTPLMVLSSRAVQQGEPLRVILTKSRPTLLTTSEITSWIEQKGTGRILAYNRKIVKAVTSASGELLDLLTVSASIAAHIGCAAFEVGHQDDRTSEGIKVAPPIHTEMDRILTMIADKNNVPDEDTPLLGTRAYERLPHNIVKKSFELLSRIATISFARAHSLGMYARPRGVSVEAGVRDGLVARVMGLLNLNENLDSDRALYYKFSKLISGQAICQAQFAYFLPSGNPRGTAITTTQNLGYLKAMDCWSNNATVFARLSHLPTGSWVALPTNKFEYPRSNLQDEELWAFEAVCATASTCQSSPCACSLTCLWMLV